MYVMSGCFSPCILQTRDLSGLSLQFINSKEYCTIEESEINIMMKDHMLMNSVADKGLTFTMCRFQIKFCGYSSAYLLWCRFLLIQS